MLPVTDDPALAFDRSMIDVTLVRRLVDGQFPQWRHLAVTPVDHDGWDNRTFRLGPEMTVRLPSAVGYREQVDKEHRWLPVLAPRLPLPIPTPLAKGSPAYGYPFSWSVYRWVPGEVATAARIPDLTAFAGMLAEFLNALQRIDPGGGPPAGPHSFHRGGELTTYDAETRRAVERLASEVDGDHALQVWEDALAATWSGPPVWFHGDVAFGNLLVRDGRLAAVIDFGCCAVGDPSCDTVIAWTLFSGESRAAFADTLAVDDATWARGRGWAIWKALITLAGALERDPEAAAGARHHVEEVLADHALHRARTQAG